MRTLAIAFTMTFLAGSAVAADDTSPGPMHPSFELKDVTGVNVADSGAPPDAINTCGACHDARFIEGHSTHRKTDATCFSCHVDNPEAWSDRALGEDGKLLPECVSVRRAGDGKCAGCHGLIQESGDPVAIPDDYGRFSDGGPTGSSYDLTRETGAIFSGEKIADSFLNLRNRDTLDLPWDVHANRKLGCTGCHHSANNPSKGTIKTRKPPHLTRDPRIPTISDYLARPDHELASERCEHCHDPLAVHDFLPQKGRHLEVLECQSCHIPRVFGPALEWEDATVVTEDGAPLAGYRGMEEETGPINGRFSSGFAPDLFHYEGEDGRSKVGPFNLTTRWFWADDATGEPVSPEALLAAYLDGEGHAPEVVKTFDRDGDGAVARDELYLDTEKRVAAIAARLEAAGVKSPVIRSVLEAHPMFHGIANGKAVVSECGECHSTSSRLTGDPAISPRTPGGVLPTPGDNLLSFTGGTLVADEDTLSWSRTDDDGKLYVFGHSRTSWSDRLGMALFALVLLALAGHAGYRFRTRKRRRAQAVKTRKVYMYRGYERIWHWLMAASIIALMYTGFEIHYPELISVLGFETAVTLHNFLAVVMIINAFLSLFYHVASSEIRQFVPRKEGLIASLMAQANYYLRGIFLGKPHPVRKDLERKLNPLQQVTYLGLLNVLFPLQAITGALIWISSRWPAAFENLGGLSLVGPAHNLGSWLFLAFLVVHVYLTTTGHTLTSNIRAMVDGYEEIEVDEPETAVAGGENA